MTSNSDHLQCQPVATSHNKVETDNSALPAPQTDPCGESGLPGHLPDIHDWTPFPARIVFIRIFIAWILYNIVTLVALWILSQSRKGVIATNLQRKDVLFVWHFVPTAIATANALAFSAIGSASLICQPYLHLLREGGASARESLTLDYSGPLPTVAFRAMRRRHWVAFLSSTVILSAWHFVFQRSLLTVLRSPLLE
jgi:hypothetical protein